MADRLEKITAFLFCLLPFALLTGPFLSDLFLCLIALIICSINLKKLRIYFDHIILLLFFLITLFLISSFNSSDIIHSLDSSLFYFRFLLFFIATLILLNKYEDLIIKYIYYILFFTLFILSLDSLIEFFFNRAFFGLVSVPEDSIRLKSLFILIDEPIVGAFISKLLPLFIGFYMISNQKNNYFYFSLLVHLSCLVIFLSGERVAFLYAFITYFFYSIYFIREKINKTLIVIFGLLIFFSISIKPNIYERMINQTLDQVLFEKEEIAHASNLEKSHTKFLFNIYSVFPTFSSQHLGFINTSLMMYEEKPLLGHGPKMFDLNCKKYEKGVCSNHPHQIYMQLISETGVISFLLILYIFFNYLCIFLKYSILSFKNNLVKYRYCIFFMLPPLLYLFPFLPSGSFFTNWNTVLFYFGFSISYFYIKKIK